MSDSQHITKTENDQVENAIQIRTNDPSSPVNGQIWFNSTSVQVEVAIGSNNIPLKTRALAADPPSPQEGETWINTTTGQFKYRTLGVTHVVDMEVSTNTTLPTGSLYAILTAEELGTLSNSGILYPNAIVDDFNQLNPVASYSNVAAQGQSLKLVAGQNSGHVDYDFETSTVARTAQGIAVYTPNAFKPLTIVDNGNGTSTVTVAGDLTGYLAVGKSMLAYKELPTNNDIRSIYVTDPATNYPLQMVVTAASYNNSTQSSTVTFSQNGVDIVAQLGISQTEVILYPLDVAIKAGAGGIAGVQPMPLVDAHGLTDLRTLGGDAFRVVTGDLPVSTIIKSRSRISQNGQYALIAVIHMLPNGFGEMVFYYSNDALSTVNRMVGSYSMGGSATFDTDELTGQERFLNNGTILVNNDGRFMLAHPFLNPAGNNHLNRLAYGNLTDSSPSLTYFADMGGGPGVPYINTQPNVNLTPVAIVPDDTWNYVYVSMTSGEYPNAQSGEDIWYSNGGATFLGTSGYYESRWANTSSYGAWYNNLEGEKQLVILGQIWNTGYTSIKKKKLSQILASANLNKPGQTFTEFQTNPGLDGETRTQILSTDEGIIYGASFDTDAIRFIYYNLSQASMEYGQINLGSVIAGADSIQHIAFSSQPASGQWSLRFNGQTTSTLGFSATAAQIQAALRAISTINGPYVNVTGDYIAGFNIEFVGTLGLQPQSLMTVPTNTLQNNTPASVTVTVTSAQAGLLPVPPTFNAAGYRWAGTGDRVILLPGGHSIPSSDQAEGMGAQTYQGTMQNMSNRFKKDPLNNDRLIYVHERVLDIGPYQVDGLITQIDDTSTFLGMFQDNAVGSNNFDGYIRDVTDTFSGDKIAQLITVSKTLTLKNVMIRIQGGYNTSPIMPNGFRTRDMHLRCKLVGVDTAGNPDETNVLAISPTLHPLANIPWTATAADTYFRFSLPVTAGQQFFAVFYTENFTASVDWPYGQQGAILDLLGSTSAPVGMAYYRNGNWTINNGGGLWIRLFDHWVEPLRSPDTFKYSRMDINSCVSYYGSHWNIQGELVGNNQIAFTYEYGANSAQDAALYPQKKTAYRLMNLPAIGTFLTDVNSPATQFLGVDPEVFDPNLMLHVRLGDPMATNLNMLGLPRSETGDATQTPLRYVDWAGASSFNWNFGTHAQLNNTAVGMQPDPRFKSGWCEKFGKSGLIYFYQGSYGDLKADNWIIEMEFIPTALDIAGALGGTTMLMSYANSNGWYFGLQNGIPTFVVQNIHGTNLVQSQSLGVTPLVAGQYYRLRATRGDDQNIRLYTYTDAMTGWQEVQYRYQANCNNQYFINYDLPFYVGGYYNNTYLTDGQIGEVKMAIGTASFKSDGLVDQRNMYAHENLGGKIIAKQYINNGQTVNGNADSNTQSVNTLNVLTPGQREGLYAAHDQLLVYRNLSVPNGKEVAASVHLDRVSDDDQPAVQGFLVNFSK